MPRPGSFEPFAAVLAAARRGAFLLAVAVVAAACSRAPRFTAPNGSTGERARGDRGGGAESAAEGDDWKAAMGVPPVPPLPLSAPDAADTGTGNP